MLIRLALSCGKKKKKSIQRMWQRSLSAKPKSKWEKCYILKAVSQETKRDVV